MSRHEVVIDAGSFPGAGSEFLLSGREGRHLSRVKRIGRGATVRVKDGLGNAFAARVRSVNGDTVRLVIGERELCPDDTVPVTLAPALIKAGRMNWLVQKACEIGAMEIQPVITERTVVKIGDGHGPGRCRRWEEIARQALKQCGGNMLTRIYPPVPLITLLESAGSVFKIMLWEGRDGKSMLSVLQGADSPVRLIVLTGPEGGFTPDELERCLERGFVTATLGSRILRAETAAVCALAQISAFFHADIGRRF